MNDRRAQNVGAPAVRSALILLALTGCAAPAPPATTHAPTAHQASADPILDAGVPPGPPSADAIETPNLGCGSTAEATDGQACALGRSADCRFGPIECSCRKPPRCRATQVPIVVYDPEPGDPGLYRCVERRPDGALIDRHPANWPCPPAQP